MKKAFLSLFGQWKGTKRSNMRYVTWPTLSNKTDMGENNQTPAIVLDAGSDTCKAGTAGDDAPGVCIPSIVGQPRFPHITAPFSAIASYVGKAAYSHKGILSLEHPIEKGIVRNWEDMNKILHHIFYNELQINPEKHAVLCTEALLNPAANREQMTQIMFEEFGVPAFYVAISGILSLYANGTLCGLMLDIGDGVSTITPVYEGYWLKHAVGRIDLGGRDSTHYLAKLLRGRDHSFTEAGEFELVKEMKEKLSYVALDYDDEMNRAATSSVVEKEYDLPDGKSIVIGSERFKAPEVIFNPSLIGLESPGIHHHLHNAIMKCSIDTRKDLYTNMIISGGATLCKSFGERLAKEMTALIPGKGRIKIISPPERKYSAWIGGSILASMSSFSSMWITRKEYDEYGPYIAHKKCLSCT